MDEPEEISRPVLFERLKAAGFDPRRVALDMLAATHGDKSATKRLEVAFRAIEGKL